MTLPDLKNKRLDESAPMFICFKGLRSKTTNLKYKIAKLGTTKQSKSL